MENTREENRNSINLNEKIKEIGKEFGFRLLSLVLFKIKGKIDLGEIQKFIKTHYIRKDIWTTEGFQREPHIEKDILMAYYGKEGIRTLRFTDEYSKIIPVSLETVPDLSKIQFITQNDCVGIIVFGGSEKFIERNVHPILNKIASSSGGKLFSPCVSQDFIRKLCLHIHRKNVDYIKIDPSKSKNYAKVVKEELERVKNKKYEYIVEEGIFKGSGILESNALKTLFEKEQDIIIQEFKSKMSIHYKGKIREVTYQIDTYGKIRFFVEGYLVNAFNDEFEAGSKLLKKLEEDAEKQLLLTDNAEVQKEMAQKTLIDFTISKEYLFELFRGHIETKNYNALPSILRDFKNVELTGHEKDEILKAYINLLENDMILAYEYIESFTPFFDNKGVGRNQERLTNVFKNMDSETLFKFLDKGVEPFAKIINPIISAKETKRNNLKNIWKRVTGEINNIKKGKLLEDFSKFLFSFDEGLKVESVNFRTKDEEIDILLKNKLEDSFWNQLNSPFIFAECKNWSSKVGSNEIKTFKGKLQDHGNLCRVGIFITVNGFTSSKDIEQIRVGAQNKILCLIDGVDIQKFLNSKLTLKEFLEKLIRDSIR
jgi:hypothetical protein